MLLTFPFDNICFFNTHNLHILTTEIIKDSKGIIATKVFANMLISILRATYILCYQSKF